IDEVAARTKDELIGQRRTEDVSQRQDTISTGTRERNWREREVETAREAPVRKQPLFVVVRVTARQTCAIGDVVVNPQNVFPPWVFRGDGRCEVEIVAPRNIRQRVEIENRLAAAIEAVLRDLVENSAVAETGRRIRCIAVAAEQRILDEDLVTVAVGRLGKIPGALEQSRYANVVGAHRRELLVPLLIPVEEELVLFAVEPAEWAEDF